MQTNSKFSSQLGDLEMPARDTHGTIYDTQEHSHSFLALPRDLRETVLWTRIKVS